MKDASFFLSTNYFESIKPVSTSKLLQTKELEKEDKKTVEISKKEFKNGSEESVKKSISVGHYFKESKFLNESVESILQKKHISADDAKEIVSLLKQESKLLAKATDKIGQRGSITKLLNLESEKTTLKKAKDSKEEVTLKAVDRLFKGLSEVALDSEDKDDFISCTKKLLIDVSSSNREKILDVYSKQIMNLGDDEYKLYFLHDSVQKLLRMNPKLSKERSDLVDDILLFCSENKFDKDMAILFNQEEFFSCLTEDQISSIQKYLGLNNDLDTDKRLGTKTSINQETLSYFEELGKGKELVGKNSHKVLGFLDSIIGDKEFNKIARAYKDSKQRVLDRSFTPDESEDESTQLKKMIDHKNRISYQDAGLDLAITLSYKLDTEKLEKLAQIDKKLTYILGEISEKTVLPETEDDFEHFTLDKEDLEYLSTIDIPEEFKLTLRDTGLIASTNNMYSDLTKLLEICGEKSKIGHLSSQVLEVTDKYIVLGKILTKTMPYESGDLSFDNRVVEEKVFGRKLNRNQQGQRLLTGTNYDHGATILKSDTGDLQFAHVMGNYYSCDINLENYCYQDTYRLDWNTILTKEEKKDIQNALDVLHKEGNCFEIDTPEQLMQELYETEYKKLINELSKEWKGDNNVDNPYSRRYATIKESIKGQFISKSVDNKDVFKDPMKIKDSLKDQKEIFCTEFQAKVTLYCWTAAQKHAYKIVTSHCKEYSLKEREKPCCLDHKKTIDFKSMHAGNVMSLFKKWIKPVPKSNFFKQIIQ